MELEQLTKNTETEHFSIKEMMDKISSNTKKIEEKLDPITEKIMAKTLPAHPEFLPEILKNLQLQKFWKQLNESSDHYVFKFLAEDRMLNFYEAACSGGFDTNSIRIGLVVAAMTSTLNTHKCPKILPTRYSYIPCFQDSKSVDLSVFDLKVLEQEHIDQATKLIKEFASKTPSIKRMDPENRLKVFLVDAFMMWTVSKNQELLDFMTNEFDRTKHLSEEVQDRLEIRHEIGCGTMIGYKPMVDLVLFHTVWGRAKSFKYSVPTIVRHLESKSLKFNN